MQGTTTDELGKVYGRLTVVGRSPNSLNGHATWRCSCECGNSTEVKGFKLRQGATKSCGCLREDNMKRISDEKYAKRLGRRICNKCGEDKEPSEYKSLYGVHCKECLRVYRRDWKHKNPLRPEANRARMIYNRYGIRQGDYNNMSVSQGGKCAICLNGSKLYVDHDHSSGKVRELLCSNCNTGLGMLKDSIELVGRALEYLTKHSAV